MTAMPHTFGVAPSLKGALRAIEPDPRAPSLFEVHWLLTRRCSYSCSYCPPHRHDPRAAQVETPKLLRGLDYLCNLLPTERIRFNLTGGEPTIHPGFLAFVAHAGLSPPVTAIRVVTNLASPERLYAQLADLSVEIPAVIQVVASFHSARARPPLFVRRIQLLASAGVHVSVKLMLDGNEPPREILDPLFELQDRYHNLAVVAQAIRGSGVTVDARFIPAGAPASVPPQSWDTRRLLHHTDEGIRESLVDDVSALIERDENHFTGWACDAGMRSLFVEADGRVYSAQCKPESEPLFNLYAEPSVLPEPRPITCPHKTCECASTVRIPKRQVITSTAGR